MEARFPDSQGTFAHNLSNMPIVADRDGALGSTLGNLTSARLNWFVDAALGDLHLDPSAVAAIDQATSAPGVDDDYDG